MAYDKKKYIRVVKRTTTYVQYWSSTAGRPDFIQKDGDLLLEVDMGTEVTLDNGFVLLEAPESIAVWEALLKAQLELREYKS